MNKTFKYFSLAFLAIALVGFADATYLTVKHYQGAAPPCSIVQGCETVTTSKYATILGIPVALLGSIYYLSIIILSITYLDTKKTAVLTVLARLTWIGLIASLYFVGLQLFVIKALCIYCIVSAGSSFTLFGLSFPLINTINKKPLLSA